VTVTKKVAGAVGRNRVKRVLREVFRRNRHLFPEGCDVVIIAKTGAPELGYEAARVELSLVAEPLARAARPRGAPRPPREMR
jgi:ribonuclease P protein component